MARVEPFKGLRYAEGVAADRNDLLAPPYDVISPAHQEALYARHPKNVVRLILGRQSPADTGADNRYTRSAADLAAWIGEGTIVADDVPALYLYAQEFTVDGKRLRRTGFICRRLVEKFGTTVFPHERTLAGPKLDRLNLTRACRTNFSPVFGMYADPSRTLDAIWAREMERTPEVDVTDDDGERHLLWPVTDRRTIATVQEFMEDRDVVIADGHHRYTTAINYRAERRAEAGDPEGLHPFDYAMMFLANSESEGFTVLATHRMVTDLPPLDAGKLAEQLGEYFDVERRPVTEATARELAAAVKAAGETAPSFGVICPGGTGLVIRFRERDRYLEGVDPESNEGIRRLLDVTILQELIFEQMLGVTREMVAEKKHVAYTIDAAEAYRRVEADDAQAAFLMNPTSVASVIRVATGGSVMPQKSTYFYPKLITGLVMNPLY